MPTNLYGLEDNYELNGSHVLPAMIRKFHEAKISGKDEVELWGDGSPLREFLYSDDLANAVVFLMESKHAEDLRTPTGDFVNVGSGKELTIKQLAEKIRDVVYADVKNRTCKIVWNTKMPNGTPRKLCDITRLVNLGWKPLTSLEQGLSLVYDWYVKNQNTIKGR